MIQLTQMPLWALIGILAGTIGLTYGVEQAANRAFAKARRLPEGLRLPLRKGLLIALNLGLFAFFGLPLRGVHHLGRATAAIPWLAAGLAFGLLIGFLTYRLILASKQETEYEKMLRRSPGSILLTVSVLVGPAEDLLFLGIIQSTLTPHLGWGAILAYLVVFVGYHALNIRSGAESFRMFLAMLPVRLIIATILSLAFYTTGSLIYGYLIHNAFDLMNAVAVLAASRHKVQQPSG